MMKTAPTYVKGWRVIPIDGAAPVDSFRWTRSNGPQISIKHQGSFSQLYEIGAQLSDQFDEIEIFRERGVGDWFNLIARQNADEIVETHERISSETNYSILTSPVLFDRFAQYGGATDAQIEQALSVIKAKTETITDQASYDAALTAGIDACTLIGLTGADALVAEVIKRLQLGNQFYLVPIYTYRHTYTMADRLFDGSLIPNLDENVGKIFTTAQLYTAESIPPDFPLPTGEWLKNGPSAALQVGQKRQVSVSYIFADTWSRLTYAEI